MLVVLECGGCDAAFERLVIFKLEVPVQISALSQSGVALRLPPHSKTLARLPVLN